MGHSMIRSNKTPSVTRKVSHDITFRNLLNWLEKMQNCHIKNKINNFIMPVLIYKRLNLKHMSSWL